MKHFFLILFIASNCLVFSQENKQNGLYEEYYENGNIRISGQYLEAKKIGEWKEYYRSGKIAHVYEYDNNGKETGFHKIFFKSGKLKSKTYKLDDGSYVTKGYYEDNGGLFYEMFTAKQKSYKYSNISRNRFKTSKFSEAKFEYEIPNGLYKEYYRNGELKIESNYKDYQLNGLWKKFYKTGEQEWEVTYFNGYKEGSYKKIHRNGNVSVKGSHLSNLKSGKEKRYNENGNLIWKGNYLKNNLNGLWTKYDNKGKAILSGYSKDGKKNSEKETKVPDGDIEQTPIFPGCENELGSIAQKKCLYKSISEYVNENFDPTIASNLGLEGKQRIHVLFNINTLGNVSNIKVDAPDQILEENAKEIIGKLPKMKPGTIRGEPVTVPYSLPIIFQVIGNAKE